MLLDLNRYGIVRVVTCGTRKDMGWLSFLRFFISAFNFLHKSILRFANDLLMSISKSLVTPDSSRANLKPVHPA